MVKCNFCGKTIEKGTGKIFAKKDGTMYNFCSGKCEKNFIKLKRKPAKTKWTEQGRKIKETMKKAKEKSGGKK